MFHNFFRKKVNEYGYKPHEKTKPFLRLDNPWLYVIILVLGILMSYVLVNVILK